MLPSSNHLPIAIPTPSFMVTSAPFTFPNLSFLPVQVVFTQQLLFLYVLPPKFKILQNTLKTGSTFKLALPKSNFKTTPICSSKFFNSLFFPLPSPF